jgi:hypothetical protein
MDSLLGSNKWKYTLTPYRLYCGHWTMIKHVEYEGMKETIYVTPATETKEEQEELLKTMKENASDECQQELQSE